MLCPCYFNSRPSARGDGPPAAEQALYAYFNSRPSARGDVQRRRNGKPVEDFNSRPSARGDAACSPLPLSSAISIHAPPRGATSAHTMRWSTALFQFTPLREGRRCGFSPIPPSAHFNSRPSARGDPTPAARRLPPSNFNSRPSARGISIHAPPRGATRIITRSRRRCPFQFTPLREGRRAGDSGHRHRPDISIHAPPRGATASGAAGHARHRISIHAPPRGATSSTGMSCRPAHNFNSRPSARGDRTSYRSAQTCSYFNSRPSARGDAPKLLEVVIRKFQFTPLREGRLLTRHAQLRFARFQFTPLREGRLDDVMNALKPILFQFTPLREGRR